MKTHISAPAHQSATGIGRVSGLVLHRGSIKNVESEYDLHFVNQKTELVTHFVQFCLDGIDIFLSLANADAKQLSPSSFENLVGLLTHYN